MKRGLALLVLGMLLGYGYYWHVQVVKICLHEPMPWLSCMKGLL